ncbi:MAG: zinc-ribbon domain-containing protein [Lentilactobacillus parabuchneri]|uniref:zinc ribbon domain-containing protein n=1 Tax=Lentilactobacillus parabuchneri TaxID=152331 RepID=UPI003F9BA7D2
MTNETKFCQSCGKEIPKAAQFCPFCGQPQTVVATKEVSNQLNDHPDPSSKVMSRQSIQQHWYKNWMVWAIIILGVGFVTCIALLNNNRTTVVMQPTASSKTTKHHTKAKTKDPKEIPSTSLKHPTRIGQWKNSLVIGTATLIGLGTKPNATIQDGPLTVKFKHAEIDKIHANTQDQLDQALDSYNKNSMSKDYTRMKIEYTVKNTSSNAINFGGIKQIIYSNGYQTNFADDSLSDTGSEDEIAAHAKRVEFALVLLGKSTSGLKPASIKILTDESEDATTYDTVTDGSSFFENISYQA